MVYGGGKKRGMRKRAYGRRPRAKTTKKGLTKTEKTQVKTIAKRAVNKMVESKYFNVNSTESQLPVPIWQYGNENSEIGCWGFTTGVRRNFDDNDTYRLGVNDITGSQVSMTSLSMNQLFRTNNSVLNRRQYAMEGLSCRPSYNEVQWLFQRPQAATANDPHRGSPYCIRMLRLKPRALKASYQDINPNTDCFLNSLNETFGPSSLSAVGGQPVMTNKEFHLAKVNSRRYQVITDTKFTMLPSSTTSEYVESEGYVVQHPSASGLKILKTNHKMGKEFHYENPDAGTGAGGSQDPSTGFEPEFILIFVAALGGNPAGVLTDNINLSVRPVSTFKDA